MGFRLLTCTTRQVTSGKQRPVDFAHVVCPPLQTPQLWPTTCGTRQVDPDSFHDWSEFQSVLHVSYLPPPLPVEGMVSPSDMIHNIAIKKNNKKTKKKNSWILFPSFALHMISPFS